MFVCCWLGDVEIMENEHIANKHLTYEEREFIEIGLNQGRNFTEIANDINKNRFTSWQNSESIFWSLKL